MSTIKEKLGYIPSHKTDGKYVTLMETSGEENESWIYFIRLDGNEENIKYRYYTFRWAILENLKNPPKEFEEIIKIHYYYKKDIILEQIDKWSSLSNDKYIYKNEDIEELKMLLSNITLQAN